MWMGRDRVALVALAFFPALTAGDDVATESRRQGDDVPPAPVPAELSHQPAEGYLGVEIREVDADDVRDLELPGERGAVIVGVREGSPADDAGLRENDVVVAWDGEDVRGTLELRRLVRETPPGREVEASFIRDGVRRSATVTVGERPGLDAPGHAFVLPAPPAEPHAGAYHLSPERLKDLSDSVSAFWSDSARMGELRDRIHERAREARARAWELREEMGEHEHRWRMLPRGGGHLYLFDARHRARLGVELRELTPQLAEYFGLEDRSGALVASVIDDSPARRAGLRAGDVILAIEGERVQDPGDVARVIRRKRAGTVEIRILRDRRERTLDAELEERAEPESEASRGAR